MLLRTEKGIVQTMWSGRLRARTRRVSPCRPYALGCIRSWCRTTTAAGLTPIPSRALSCAKRTREFAVTSRPRLSREYAYVASDQAANAQTSRAVTRKGAERGEGRLITGLVF